MIKFGATNLYSKEDIMKVLHVSKATATKIFRDARVKTIEIGRYTYIPESSLEKALNNGFKI